MINPHVKIAGLAALMLLSSGCSMFRSSGALADRQAVRAAQDIAYDGSFEYAFAREALLSQQYGKAISAFHKAELYPAYRAESANGLAIAYAALGRNDVALHYFEKAVQAAPDTVKYRVNLADLRGRMDLAARQEAAQQERAMAQAQPQPEPLSNGGSPVRIVSGANGAFAMLPDRSDDSRLVRLSSREVQLVSAPEPKARPARAFALGRAERAKAR